MEGKRSVLVPYSCAFGVATEEQLDRLERSLPHGGLMNGKITCAVGLADSPRICFE